MIISIFVFNPESRIKVFRSSSSMSALKMNYYITEFMNCEYLTEGIIEKETYNYAYTNNSSHVFVAQLSKDHSLKNGLEVVKHIEANSDDDLYDILNTIDNTLFNGEVLFLELNPIKEMDSQDEKIYKMVVENKRKEMLAKQKDGKKRIVYEDVPKTVEKVVKKVEKSSKPILIVIKEKIKMIINKDNVKENSIAGEINLVISDPACRQVRIKMNNLGSGLKFSPYLDKEELKNSTLRFEKDRGLNKNIPLLKWSSKAKTTPLSFEFWSDEDGDKLVFIVEVKANKNLKNVELRFERELTEIELEDGCLEDECILWCLGNMKKGESKTFEIKGVSDDKDAIYPISVSFAGDSIESQIGIQKVFLEDGTEITDFELRKEIEVDEFKVYNE